MKKMCIFLMTALMLLLTSCTFAREPITENTNRVTQSVPIPGGNAGNRGTSVQRLQRDIAGKFRLDQTPEEFLAVLKSEVITLNASKLTQDGRIVEWDGNFNYESPIIRAEFTKDGHASALTVISNRYATDLGIRVGSTKEELFDAYGEKYTQDEYKRWYYYTEEDYCLGFLMDELTETTIQWWRLFIPALQSEEP